MSSGSPTRRPVRAKEPASSVRVLDLAEAEQGDAFHPKETALVVDVLRATSTIAVALRQGAHAVYPARSADEARSIAASLEEAILVGERQGTALEGFVDNSPATLSKMDLQGQSVVLTTTNGTRALFACQDARDVIAGGLVNATQTAHALAGTPVALVAAGWEGKPASDDRACCAYLAELLRGGDPALEACLEQLEASTSARKLREAGKGADVDLCLRPDAAPVVPCLRGDRLVARPETS